MAATPLFVQYGMESMFKYCSCPGIGSLVQPRRAVAAAAGSIPLRLGTLLRDPVRASWYFSAASVKKSFGKFECIFELQVL